MVIFVSFGVVSGFALGSYLIDLKNTNELVFVEGPSLSIFSDKSDYKRGENITIRIINSGSETLYFSDSSYGLRITGLSGILMYSPPVTAESKEPKFELQPKQEISFVWDQIKNDGASTIEGVYKISSKTTENNSLGKPIEKSTTITIWK